ncbi:MAG: hypothetical protein Q9157_007407 [Trypethelium eluteriae]
MSIRPCFEQQTRHAPQDNSKQLDPKERKRQQNRLAQRTYRRNQKVRLRALEEAVGKYSEGLLPPTVPDKEIPVLPHDSEPEVADSGICVSNDSPPDETEAAVTGCQFPPMEQSVWPPNPGLNDISLPVPEMELGRPALHRAACRGNTSMTRLLVDKGADITIQDSLGQTALHIAVENGREEIVEILLENNANPNVKDSLGRTALFRAVQLENLEIAKRLLEAFVDVNLKDMYGNAALHFAVERESEPLTLLLLTYGADVNA